MRTEIIIALAVLIIFSLCFWSHRTLHHSHQIFAQQMTELYNAVEKENWTKAASTLDAINDHFQKIRSIWLMIVVHSRLEEIELLISQLRTEIADKSRADALKTVSTLKLNFDFIVRDEAVNLKNIF